jgi:hypothetical protein
MLTSSKWLLLLISAGHFELALLSILRGTHEQVSLAAMGLAFLLSALSSLFWVRFFATIGWAALLAQDFSQRKSAFAVFFILIALYQVYHFTRSIGDKSMSAPPPVTP